MKNAFKFGPTGLVGVLVAVAFSLPARAEDCATVKAAIMAQIKTPYAAMAVINGVGPRAGATTSETIVAGGNLYFKINGAWRSTPHSAQEEIDKLNATGQTATCVHESDDTVNGQPVIVFTVHYKESDNRLWIANATGLPVKTVARFKNGMSVSITFRYDNVHPPAL